jgi:glucoamylase
VVRTGQPSAVGDLSEPRQLRRLRQLRRAWPVAAACALLAVLTGATRPGATAPLFADGLLANDGQLVELAPEDTDGLAWVEGSTVLRRPDGQLTYLPPGATEPVTVPPDDPQAAAVVAADRAWLDAGTVPGATGRDRQAAARSLLVLRQLQRPGGGVVAAPQGYWAFVWPRDASVAAAALHATGHQTEAAAALRFLAHSQEPDGTWPARSHPDGRPVDDGRPPQLDATGWVPWAVWVVTGGGNDRELAAELWPTVRAAAHAAASALGPGGLPPAGPDYWERRERQPTLGTAAPLRAGLRAAGRLAEALDHPADAERFADAAERLDRAIRRELAGPGGYHRTPAGGGHDAAVTWLAPPFAPPEPGVMGAVSAAREALASGGGAIPGSAWSRKDPWTPATASFALAFAAGGDQPRARQTLDWLLDHRTALAAFPERVRATDGQPRSAAPLAWTHALFLLAVSAQERPLPIP